MKKKSSKRKSVSKSKRKSSVSKYKISKMNPQYLIPTNKEQAFTLGMIVGLKETYENYRGGMLKDYQKELNRIKKSFEDMGINIRIFVGTDIVNKIDTKDAFEIGKLYGKAKALNNIIIKNIPISERLNIVNILFNQYMEHKSLISLYSMEAF